MPEVPAAEFPDAVALLEAMSRGDVSSEQLVRQHLDRLAAVHHTINAATCVFREEALSESRSPRPGRLSGLPVSVKETFGIELRWEIRRIGVAGE